MSTKTKNENYKNFLRTIKIEYDPFGYADSSILFEQGKTKVLVSVTLQDGVPPFLRGRKTGWLTAEYNMLPCATHKRTKRESSQIHKNSRSVEISRLIGRSLRSIVNLSQIGEKTIIIDCDVLQADGSTRVASITAASLALKLAVKRWINSEIIEENILNEEIAAISVGIVNGEFIVDLSYIQDSNADADFNFILTKSEQLIEVQGTAEKSPILWENFEKLKNLAISETKKLFQICDKLSINSKLNLKSIKNINVQNKNTKKNKPPFFSLANRLEKKACN